MTFHPPSEDGAGVGPALLQDILADLGAAGQGIQPTVAGVTPPPPPLFALLNNAFPNQAAAQGTVEQNISLICVHRTQSAGDNCTLQVDPNISGAGVGNFRLSLLTAKGAAGDTASWILEVRFRHSIIR